MEFKNIKKDAINRDIVKKGDMCHLYVFEGNTYITDFPYIVTNNNKAEFLTELGQITALAVYDEHDTSGSLYRNRNHYRLKIKRTSDEAFTDTGLSVYITYKAKGKEYSYLL